MVDILFNDYIITRFINSPVPSNTYVISHSASRHCLIIDPGSKYPQDVIDYIKANNLILDYIILTHEHFDHCWGVNAILSHFSAKLITTRKTEEYLRIPMNYFNKLYYDSEEMFCIENVDDTVENLGMRLAWCGQTIEFIETKGHTDKSMCIVFNNSFFSGDTLLYKTKPHIKRKYGGSIKDFIDTISKIYERFKDEVMVYPGHGEKFNLGEVKDYYQEFCQQALSKDQ